MGYSAVELFCERASSRDAEFALGDDDCSVIARIVRRLDGIPLAIELATARVRALGLTTLGEPVESSLRAVCQAVIERRRRGNKRCTRLIAWSYDLLSQCEQRFALQRLSVFTGGWSARDGRVRSAATKSWWSCRALASLVEKSLVVRNVYVPETTRYTLLESTRDFAREAAGTRQAAFFGLRHARWVPRASLRKAEERSRYRGCQDTAHSRYSPTWRTPSAQRCSGVRQRASPHSAVKSRAASRSSSIGTDSRKRVVPGSNGRWSAFTKTKTSKWRLGFGPALRGSPAMRTRV